GRGRVGQASHQRADEQPGGVPHPEDLQVSRGHAEPSAHRPFRGRTVRCTYNGGSIRTMSAVRQSRRRSGPTVARASTRPTSRDVARAAGVSQAAVSLVLGDKWRGRVSETTAQRVREAADSLGYRPNLAARNLRLGRTRTVLLVVPALTTEFFAGVYTGAARVAGRHGFGVVLYPSPEGIGPARDPFASAQAA